MGTTRVGFLRVPTMSPSSTALAVQQFASEIAYFNANTDGLVIDVMSNGGGSLCYIETLASYLIPRPFRGAAYEIRATQYWAYAFSTYLTNAKQSGAPQWTIDLYAAYLAQIQQALQGNRGRTGPIPICTPNFESIAAGHRCRVATILAYTKPILLLTDEFSLSAAEAFSACSSRMKGRATVFGHAHRWRRRQPRLLQLRRRIRRAARASRGPSSPASRPVADAGLPGLELHRERGRVSLTSSRTT